MEAAGPFLSRIRIRGFQSIAACDVRLGPVTLLVGENGSGKSAFLQALAYLGQAVADTPAAAAASLGGWGGVSRRTAEAAVRLGAEVEAAIRPSATSSVDLLSARYGFDVGPFPGGAPGAAEVLRETCEIRSRAGGAWRFAAERGTVREDGGQSAAAGPGRLCLAAAADHPASGRLRRGLAGMRLYDLSADAPRAAYPAAGDDVPGRRGEHPGSVLAALASARPGDAGRLDAYLNAIIPEVAGVRGHVEGGQASVAFADYPGGAVLGAEAVPEGTVRAAGVLAALFRLPAADGRVLLVGLENPETGLHPRAGGVLLDAITEAADRQVRVIAATHSPDLLDGEDSDASMVRVVAMDGGQTVIGEVDDVSSEIVAGGLRALGELMRGSQLLPRQDPDTPPDSGQD